MRNALVALVAFVAVAHAAPEIDIPGTTTGVLAPGVADKIATAGAKPTIRVLDTGSGAKSELVYSLTKGQSRKMAMVMDMAMTIAVMGRNQSVTIPTMTLVFDITTVDKNAKGEFQVDATVTSTQVDGHDAIATQLRGEIAKMKGVRMTYWVDPKGYIHDGKVDMPPDMPAQMRQMMGNMTQSLQSLSMPLPSEPIGVGGRWQGVTRISSNGADILQSAVHTLRARTGNTATLDIALRQVAASDTISSGGVSSKVKQFSSAGEGRVELDLTTGMPNVATMHLKMGMDIDAAGQSAHMDMSMTIGVKRP